MGSLLDGKTKKNGANASIPASIKLTITNRHGMYPAKNKEPSSVVEPWFVRPAIIITYRYNSAIYNSKKDVRFVLVCSQRSQAGSRQAGNDDIYMPHSECGGTFHSPLAPTKLKTENP